MAFSLSDRQKQPIKPFKTTPAELLMHNTTDIQKSETLTARIKKRFFSNPQKGWAVATATTTGDVPVTICGAICDAPEHQKLLFLGSWVVHSKYGRQFVAGQYTVPEPTSAEEIRTYLRSGVIKGISPVIGSRIFEAFGLDSLKVISETPERLLAIRGIAEKRLTKIQASFEKTRGTQEVMLFLMQYDITPNLAGKIFRTYGLEAIERLKANPYCLADDVYGVGFLKADTVALSMGIDPKSQFRLAAATKYVLQDMSTDGHCFAAEDDLLKTLGKIVEADETQWHSCWETMCNGKELVREEGRYYLPEFYEAECTVADRLTEILSGTTTNLKTPSLVEELLSAETMAGFTRVKYAPEQLEAIRTALEKKVMVVTGGPGTGKTTSVNGIIQAFTQSGLTVTLAAPTGRASKRMTETTGVEAKTIHRLIGYGTEKGFTEPVKGDVLVLDECSMIDLPLMAQLLKALPETMRIVFCGDVDQLPSVGPGCVFRDIIESGVIPVVRLQTIYRQSQRSDIVLAAHEINKGNIPVINNDKDLYFQPVHTDESLDKGEAQVEREKIADFIETFVAERITDRFAIVREDIQVLCPMRKMEIGTNALNLRLQEALNPTGEVLTGFVSNGATFRVRDRVMQVVNDYRKEVFNGDIGTVKGWQPATDNEDERIVVSFDGREVAYTADEVTDLQLAYATTIHKAQGSEYKAVVIPVSTSNVVMLQRNLLYTGVTRAKKLLLLIGTKKALAMAVKNASAAQRRTGLKERLSQNKEELNHGNR